MFRTSFKSFLAISITHLCQLIGLFVCHALEYLTQKFMGLGNL